MKLFTIGRRSVLTLTITLTLLSGAIALAQDNVTFSDVANSGISASSMEGGYERVPSFTKAIWDQIREGGILAAFNLINTPHKWRGSPGVALLDYDGDGDVDIYVTNGPGADNSLYVNRLRETGTLSFADVGAAAGVGASDHDSSGVCFGDTDNDGDEDLFVLSAFDSNRFFENNGDGTFVDISAISGLSNGVFSSMSCTFGDVNGDGLLDVAVANSYLDFSNLVGIAGPPFDFNLPNQLFINAGDNTFIDASTTSGIQNLRGFPGFEGSATLTWAIAMVDYDQDGDVDIVHADDQAGVPKAEFGGIDRGFIHILENDGHGSFTDVTVERGMNNVGEWMGLSFGDINGDGHLDIFGSNVGDYALTTTTPIDPVFGNQGVYRLGDSSSRWFLGSAEGDFSDPGVGDLVATPFGWGTSMTDYDNDGDIDIVYHGGMAIGPTVHCDNMGILLRNDGQGNFSYDELALANSTDHQRRNVHGVATGDLNNDGFPDIVTVSNFDIQDSIPIQRFNVEWGSPFDGKTGYQATFLPTETLGIWAFSGIEDNVNGSLGVEVNSAGNGRGWLKVELRGGAGTFANGGANRDGIGAVVEVTAAGRSATRPVLGGSSFASQDSRVLTFGLGTARRGTVDVLWPGGVRNRLYNVRRGESVVMPEIPCSYDSDVRPHAYARCVRRALGELSAAGAVDLRDKIRLFASAIRAYYDER